MHTTTTAYMRIQSITVWFHGFLPFHGYGIDRTAKPEFIELDHALKHDPVLSDEYRGVLSYDGGESCLHGEMCEKSTTTRAAESQPGG